MTSPPGQPAARSRWRGALHQRCPDCLRGPVFAGYLSMHEQCPVCGRVFEREEGYFLGAMYISYALSIGCLLVLTLAAYLVFPNLDLGLAVLASSVVYLPLAPVAWRYSRILWMYFDNWASPEKW